MLYRECERLLLDGLLELKVVLIGDVQRKFQFGDLHLELLLDPGHFGFELGLGFNDPSVQLFDFNAGLLAEIKKKGKHRKLFVSNS